VSKLYIVMVKRYVNMKSSIIGRRWLVLLIIIMLFLGGCIGASPDTSKTTSTTMLPHGANGAIESMTLITATENSEYYTLTYWSDGLRVTGFFGRPKGEGVYPAIIYNRGGCREYGALQGWEIVPLVEAGYVAVASQYRGNAGSEG